MTHNATGGPTIVYGQNPTVGGTTYTNEYNNEAAPSLFYAGSGLLDARWGYQVKGGRPMAVGFQGSTNIAVLQGTPSTASTSILAASQTPTTNVALTLATQSTTGLTVLSAALVVYPAKTTMAIGTLAIEGTSGTIIFRTGYVTPGASNSGGVQLYDPTRALARNVRIQTSGGDSAGSYLVSGYDIYGYAMTESIPGTSNAAGGIQSGKKAFKYISSVLPRGTIVTTTLSVGTGDVFGFPIRADGFGDLNEILVGNTSISVSTGFVASSTITATSSTGDVRGTYALQTASNGVNAFQLYQTPRASNIGSTTGVFGVSQA